MAKKTARPKPVALQTPEARAARTPVSAPQAVKRGSLPATVKASLLMAQAMSIARTFCSFLNPENRNPAISNWPTQLLGNRILSGSITYTVGGKQYTHGISGFMPSRNLKTGKPEKGAVKKFRLAYESGMPNQDAARIEMLNLLTYCTLSASTGELPSPNRPSGESTIKASIAHRFLTEAGITLDSVVVSNLETGVSLTLTGESVMGILSAFDQNRKRVESTWIPRTNAKAEQAGTLEWENI